MRDGWQRTTLGNVADLTIGRTPPRKESEYWTTDLTYPFLSIAQMSGKFADPASEGVTEAALASKKAKLVPTGSLLMSFKLTIGKVAFAARDLATNEAIVWIEPRPDSGVTKEYLALALEAADLNVGENRAVKGATLNRSSLEAIQISIPSLEVQRRIVDLIEHIDQAVTHADRLSACAEAARQALIGMTFSSRDANARVADLCQVRLGRQRSPKHYDGDHVVPYLRAANVQEGYIVTTDVKAMNFTPDEQATYSLQPGDVLLQEGGTPPGTGSPYRGEVKGTVCFQNTVVRLRPISGTEPGFLWLLASWLHHSGQFAAISHGTNNIQHLGAGRVAEILVPRLSSEEQQSLVEQHETIEAVRQSASAEADVLRDVRVSALAELLSGEREIPDSYDRFLDVDDRQAA